MKQTFDSRGRLHSDLWLDQPDAHDRIQTRLDGGHLSSRDAEQLHSFTENGYLRFSLDLDPDYFSDFDAEIDDLWESRPADVAFVRRGERFSFRDATSEHRQTRHRIPDVHTHVSKALDLYTSPQVSRMVDLIFDEPGVPFQSLYFQVGSGQSLHRDPMFVPATPPSHMVAAWTALEDIAPESGPLLYIPGSHRMPWYGPTVLVSKDARGDAWRQGWSDYLDRMVKEMNLQIEAYCGSRGEVFIWHAGLVHGGAPVTDQRKTRKSFVVHYSTAATNGSRPPSMRTLLRRRVTGLGSRRNE